VSTEQGSEGGNTREENSRREEEQAAESTGAKSAETGSSGPAAAGEEADVAAAGDERTKLEEEVKDLREQLLMTQADMQNVRKRAERDVENAHKYALEKFVGDLVSVVDNLERAVDTIDRDDPAQEKLGEGVELTLRGFQDVLQRYNVEAVNPQGETFDPDRHQAMSMVPAQDAEPNTVIEVYQKGYTLNGRLVRPAMVVVAKG
jgi:molecular chaperone GrpE